MSKLYWYWGDILLWTSTIQVEIKVVGKVYIFLSAQKKEMKVLKILLYFRYCCTKEEYEKLQNHYESMINGNKEEVMEAKEEKQSFKEQYDEIVIKNRFKYEDTRTEKKENSKSWSYDDMKNLKMKVQGVPENSYQ